MKLFEKNQTTIFKYERVFHEVQAFSLLSKQTAEIRLLARHGGHHLLLHSVHFIKSLHSVLVIFIVTVEYQILQTVEPEEHQKIETKTTDIPYINVLNIHSIL